MKRLGDAAWPHQDFLENLMEELIYLAILRSLVLAARPTLYPKKSELKKEHTIIQKIF